MSIVYLQTVIYRSSHTINTKINKKSLIVADPYLFSQYILCVCLRDPSLISGTGQQSWQGIQEVLDIVGGRDPNIFIRLIDLLAGIGISF